MTLWELVACIDGVNRANSPEADIEPPTDQEFEQMLLDYDHLRASVQ